MHQTRRAGTSDCDARFAALSQACALPSSDASQAAGVAYGLDPTFNARSVLFDATLSAAVSDFYNTSQASPEVTAQGLPHAFFRRAVPGFGSNGFPVVFQVRARQCAMCLCVA